LTTRIHRLLDQDDADGQFLRAGMQAAIEGNFDFWRYIYDRIEGKLPEKLEAQVAAAMPRPIFQRIDNPRDKDLPRLDENGEPPALDVPNGDEEATS
jgi:hypothetical protein